MSKQSEVVILDVLMKHETVHTDIIAIMKIAIFDFGHSWEVKGHD